MLKYIHYRIRVGIKSQAESAGVYSQLDVSQWIQGDVAVSGDIHPLVLINQDDIA
jgi:hypothetical protein